MRHFLLDADDAMARAARLRARMMDRFTVEKMTADILAFYASCMGDRKPDAARSGREAALAGA